MRKRPSIVVSPKMVLELSEMIMPLSYFSALWRCRHCTSIHK